MIRTLLSQKKKLNIVSYIFETFKDKLLTPIDVRGKHFPSQFMIPRIKINREQFLKSDII